MLLPARFVGSPRGDEGLGLHPDHVRNGDEIGLMRLEEAHQREEQGCVIRRLAKLLCPDSGQVEEPPCASFVGQSRGQGNQRERMRVGLK